MKKSWRILLALSVCLFNHSLFAHFDSPKTMVVQLELEAYSLEMLQLRSWDMDVAGVDVTNQTVDVVVDNEDFRFLSSKGYLPEIVSHFLFDEKIDDEYFNPEEITTFLMDMNEAYPDLTTLKIIGESVEGRSIYAIKISDNADQREDDEPTILFNSMHHAREIMTPEVSTDIISYLLENYDSDEKVAHWVNSNEIWVVPMLNVDGNNIVWTRYSLWRKNARGGYGVDLNRNYPEGWRTCNGSSGNRRSQTYRGPSPASEPETQALMGLVAEVKPVFDISYHSYSQLVLYPYGCDGRRVGNRDVVEGIGKELGEILDYNAGTIWELLYSADGGDIDWMHAQHQVIPYVFELNSSRQGGFHPSYSKHRDKTVKKNRAAWMHLLDKLDESALRGKVIGADQFNVNVYKGDTLYQTYRGNPDGTFHIVLRPGSYKFEFKSLDNKNLTQVKDIEIAQQRVDLNINF